MLPQQGPDVSLEVLVCETCGITFGVPKPLYLARAENGDALTCPNGHDCFFGEFDEEEDAAIEAWMRDPRAQLRARIRQIHDEEQQAAAERDKGEAQERQAREAQQRQAQALPATVPAPRKKYEPVRYIFERIRIIGGRWECPICRKTFHSKGWVATHLLGTHEADAETCNAVRYGRVPAVRVDAEAGPAPDAK